MDKHLIHYKGSIQVMLLTGVLTLAQAAAIIVQAVYLAKAIVHLYEGANWQTAISAFTIFFIAHTARHFLQWAKSRLAFRFANRTSLEYQNLLVRKLFQIGPRAISQQGTGNLVTLCLEGIPQFRTYLELFIPRFISMICIPAVLLVYFFLTDAGTGAILITVLPIMIGFLILLGLAAQKQKDARWETYQLLSRHFTDSLRGLVTLKFLGRSKRHKKAIWEVSNKYRIATNRTLRVAFLSSFSLDFFSTLSVAVVAVELGIRLLNGHIGFEPALALLILAPEYFMPIRDLGSDYHATMDGKEAGEKIHRLLAMEQGLGKDLSFPVQAWNAASTLSVEGLEKKSAEENRTILQEVSFQVHGFKKIGIIGVSGAGKSTLIDLLSGFSAVSGGHISIDGTQVPHFSFREWQQQVNYIPQHPYIFAGSVKENIAWYAPDAPLEKIEEAVRITGLSELVQSFPNGLDEIIGQGGRALSGGEEQRIALARALLDSRPVMLFDEPTAHLDIETEQEIKRLMLPLLEHKLVFFATHRLHWMKQMDEILVMEDGKLAESGTFDELYRRNGAFYKLVMAHRGGRKDEVLQQVH
ncbi:thiol reductant ABC exporter subunit CydD [Heyndrickxia acidiproducens]|uniref:thiol reductant ABC exporter subunit CydD n=1 Tax=Heyndrickxia acidiproducens TaxID=1121084 RepID=UPI000379D84F|nr:thiol reductant ABC exporter subunit CydD [Heyndrickxia acidiproducens]